jgi:hypothetical protein
MLDVGCLILNSELSRSQELLFNQTSKINNQKSFSAFSAYISKFVPEATTPLEAAKELPLVAFSSLWLCASIQKAFRFRRGVRT